MKGKRDETSVNWTESYDCMACPLGDENDSIETEGAMEREKERGEGEKRRGGGRKKHQNNYSGYRWPLSVPTLDR